MISMRLPERMLEDSRKAATHLGKDFTELVEDLLKQFLGQFEQWKKDERNK